MHWYDGLRRKRRLTAVAQAKRHGFAQGAEEGGLELWIPGEARPAVLARAGALTPAGRKVLVGHGPRWTFGGVLKMTPTGLGADRDGGHRSGDGVDGRAEVGNGGRPERQTATSSGDLRWFGTRRAAGRVGGTPPAARHCLSRLIEMKVGWAEGTVL